MKSQAEKPKRTLSRLPKTPEAEARRRAWVNGKGKKSLGSDKRGVNYAS